MIFIHSDVHNSDELFAIFGEHDAEHEFNFQLIENPESFRSSLADPTILAAGIQAAASVLTSLITLIGVIWTARGKEDKTVIVLKMNQAPQASAEKPNQIMLPVAGIKQAESQQQLEHISLQEIESISIIEDL